MTGCYRHPDREANIRCQRCEQPICVDCMRPAAVGFQCPQCVASGNKSVRQPRTLAGALVPAEAGRISWILIGINVAVFVLERALASGGTIFASGAMNGIAVAHGEYWRLLTSEFLHSGVLHLVFNMYALYLFGPVAERALGTLRFVVAYLTMAVVASAFVYVLAPATTMTVGASGAIFGLFGLVLVLMIRARQDVGGLLVLLVINGLISLSGGISWQAHLGGFLAGVVLGAAFGYAPRKIRGATQVAVIAAMWIGTVIAVAGHTVALTSGITSL